MNRYSAARDGYGPGRLPPPQSQNPNARVLVDGYAKDILNNFEGDAPRYNPLNTERPESSVLVDLKDPIQVHLLTETALSDSNKYEILSQEEVDSLKKQVYLLTQRIQQARTNLKIQTKYRDAAVSMSRLYSPGKQDSGRRLSLLNRNSGGNSGREAERERLVIEKKCEELASELWSLEKRIFEPQRRLLEHTAGVLQLTHKNNKKNDPQNKLPPFNGIPGSPESLYTLSNQRDSAGYGNDAFLDDRSLYSDDGEVVPSNRAAPVQREEEARLKEEADRLRKELTEVREEADRLRRSEFQLRDEASRRRSMDTKLREEIDRLRQSGDGTREEADRLRNEEAQLRAQSDSLASALDALQRLDAGRVQAITATEQRLGAVSQTFRDVLVKVNPRKNSEYRSPPAGPSKDAQPGDTIEDQFDYLEKAISIVLKDKDVQSSEGLQAAEAAAANTSIALAQAESRVDALNEQFKDILLTVDSNYPTPPDSTAAELEQQFDYADNSLRAVEAELKRIADQSASNALKKRENDQSETVLMGLWEIIQSGYADIQQRNEERRKTRIDQGLQPDDDDASADEAVDLTESYSLSAFSARVQWLYAQATQLKDQKSILKRQIKQQRELNSKSDSAKDAELQSTKDEIEQVRAMLQTSEKEAAKSQQMLSDALKDVEEVNATRAADISNVTLAREQLEQRDAKIASLEAESKSLQQKMMDATQSISTMESQVGASDEQIASLRARLAGAEKFAEDKQQEAEAKAREAEAKAAEAKQKEMEVKQKEEELEALNGTLVELKTELTFAQAELDGAYGTRKERAVEAAAVKNTVEVQNLKNEIERLKNELGGTLKELEAITSETIGSEREKIDIESRLDDALADRASLELEVASLRDRLESEMEEGNERLAKLQEDLDAERLRVTPTAGGATRVGAGASMLSEQFRATMKQERKKFQEDLREEQAKRRKLEDELQKLRKAQGPGKSPLSPR